VEWRKSPICGDGLHIRNWFHAQVCAEPTTDHGVNCGTGVGEDIEWTDFKEVEKCVGDMMGDYQRLSQRSEG
jgi:hypothetical protein